MVFQRRKDIILCLSNAQKTPSYAADTVAYTEKFFDIHKMVR